MIPNLNLFTAEYIGIFSEKDFVMASHPEIASEFVDG